MKCQGVSLPSSLRLADLGRAPGLDVAHLVGHGDARLLPLMFTRASLTPSRCRGRPVKFTSLRSSGGDEVVGRAQGRLHHAAGGAEDRARAGVRAQDRAVGFLVRAGSGSRCRLLDHARQLARGEGPRRHPGRRRRHVLARPISNFLAVQGMIETRRSSSGRCPSSRRSRS
jgi:hypothetical protein